MYRAVNDLLQPYTLFVLGLIAAYLNLWRRRSETRRRLLLLAVPLVLLVLLSSPLVSYIAFGSLEWQFSPPRKLPSESQAVVVLGGWLLGKDDYQAKPVLADSSLYRCFCAAELYRQNGPCPVVVTGGAVDEYDATSVAQLMKEFLISQGVAPTDLLLEDRALSTYENAVECEKLLNSRGIKRITLVTDALHMKRAASCFRKVGFEVTPAACNYQASRLEFRLGTFLPAVGAARGNQQVCHEWLGLAWYWLRGRL